MNKYNNIFGQMPQIFSKNKLFSLDATMLKLCTSLFDRAKLRTTKGAVMLHLFLNRQG